MVDRDTGQVVWRNPRLADLETCAHRHQILASVVEADPTRPYPTVTLYHCCHEHQPHQEHQEHQEHPPAAAMPVQTTAVPPSPDNLAAVKGFADLDTICLPDGLDVAAALSASMAAAPHARLLDLVRQLPVADQGGRFVQFFAFDLHSNRPDALFAEGRTPVWKWAKPSSAYGLLAGFWETELQQTLEDGAWHGGKELVLLVRGLSEPAWQALADFTLAGNKAPSLGILEVPL